MAMLRPSYNDLMEIVNGEVEEGEHPVINSRYSIVLATAKRARQIIADGTDERVTASRKPLSIAVEELSQGKIQILGEEEAPDEEEGNAEPDAENAEELQAEESK